MARDNTQVGQTLIYTRQGGNEVCFESGSFLWFIDTLFTPVNLRTQLDNGLQMTILGNMTGDTSRVEGGGAAGTPVVLPSRQGLIIFSCDTEVSDGSATLCSGYSGQKMTIMTRGGGADVSICIQAGGHTSGLGAGAWVMGRSDEVSCSCVTILGSVSMNGILHLHNVDGVTWSVVTYNAKTVDGIACLEAFVFAPG